MPVEFVYLLMNNWVMNFVFASQIYALIVTQENEIVSRLVMEIDFDPFAHMKAAKIKTNLHNIFVFAVRT